MTIIAVPINALSAVLITVGTLLLLICWLAVRASLCARRDRERLETFTDELLALRDTNERLRRDVRDATRSLSQVRYVPFRPLTQTYGTATEPVIARFDDDTRLDAFGADMTALIEQVRGDS